MYDELIPPNLNINNIMNNAKLSTIKNLKSKETNKGRKYNSNYFLPKNKRT